MMPPTFLVLQAATNLWPRRFRGMLRASLQADENSGSQNGPPNVSPNISKINNMTGWWFGPFFIFHLWDVILNPLTNSYFSRWLKLKTTNQMKKEVLGWVCSIHFFSSHPGRTAKATLRLCRRCLEGPKESKDDSQLKDLGKRQAGSVTSYYTSEIKRDWGARNGMGWDMGCRWILGYLMDIDDLW